MNIVVDVVECIEILIIGVGLVGFVVVVMLC